MVRGLPLDRLDGGGAVELSRAADRRSGRGISPAQRIG